MKKETMVTAILERGLSALAALTFFCFLLSFAVSQAPTQPPADQPGKPELFKTAQEAAEALIGAAENYDENRLQEIFGSDSYDIIHTGEPNLDKAVSVEFAAQA